MPGCWNKAGLELLLREGPDPFGLEAEARRLRKEEKYRRKVETFTTYIEPGKCYPHYMPRTRRRRLAPSLREIAERQEAGLPDPLHRPSTTGSIGKMGSVEAAPSRASLVSRETPAMPNIDSHIRIETVKWVNVMASLRRARTSHLLVRPVIKDTITDDTPEKVPGELTTSDIKLVLQYIDSLGDGDGLVSYKELETAFRRARRVRAAQAFEEEGRQLVYRLENVFQAQNLNTKKFFLRLDVNRGGQGDGKISLMELRTGLTRLTDAEEMASLRFSEEDVLTLLRYMDPNADGELELSEVEDAFHRAHTTTDELAKERAVGRVIDELDQMMEKRKKRLIDLFRELDTDNSGSLTLSELKDGLKRAAMPSAEKRAKAKLKIEKALEESRQLAKKREHEEEIKAKFRAAKESGALSVLLKLEQWLHENKLRIKDVFTKAGFDSSGDGSVDMKEFGIALERLNIHVPKKEIHAIVNFLDQNGDQEIQADELEAAFRDLKQAKAILLGSAQQQQPKRRQPKASVRVKATKNPLAITSAAGLDVLNPSLPHYKVYSGDMLDLRWLEGFDRDFTYHMKKLVRCY